MKAVMTEDEMFQAKDDEKASSDSISVSLG
jgi:hypothetical protein